MRKCLVVSAVNLNEGGPLTILRDCLSSAIQLLPPEWDIFALVHDKKLIDLPRVKLIEIPQAKRSWLRRLYYEWIDFKKISLELKPHLWLSLHDITPRVVAQRQIVYCHNASPFYNLSWREAWLEPNLWLFNKFYGYLYAILIQRNYLVVVQQEWLRNEFEQMSKDLSVVVAHPSIKLSVGTQHTVSSDQKVIFFYPALARVFKNFEIIFDAAKLLMDRGLNGFEIRVTLKGDENRYAKLLYKNYDSIPVLKFIGLQSREEMAQQYQEAAAVIFPSKLESWGLPITEAKAYKKPILVADMPYAHETIGTYERVSFFPPTDAFILADLMQAVIEKRWQPVGARKDEPLPPFAHNWDELWHLMTEGL